MFGIFSLNSILRRIWTGDLWGPLFLCMTLSLTLSLSTSSDGATLFLAVFLTVVLGASVVTFNAKLLGGKVWVFLIIFLWIECLLFRSLLQTIGVLGYCLFPICISTLLIALLGSILVFWGEIIICSLAFIWSSLCNISFYLLNNFDSKLLFRSCETWFRPTDKY